MAGVAHPRTLTSPLRMAVDGLVFEVAQHADNDALRALLRDNPLPGWVSLSYEREPNYFLATTLEGDVQQTMIARETTTGRIVGVFSRSEFDAFINGREQRVGYLGQLRVDPAYQGQVRRLRQGYEACRTLLHQSGRAPFYLTSIVTANERARRLLLAGLPGLPTYRALAPFSTLVLPTRQFAARAGKSDMSVRQATVADLPQIAALLQRRYRRYQCAPIWTEEALRSPERCRGLTIEDFFVAESAGSMVGCAALWDQQSFKQQVVRGYSARVRRWRRLFNVFALLSGLPRLPAIDATLRLVYLSHLAVANDEPKVLKALIKTVGADARRRGHDLLTFGLAEAHSLLPLVKRRFRHFEYHSLLCLVYWEDSKAAAEALDGRPVHAEIATL